MDDLYYAMQDFHRLTEANDALQAQVAQRDAEIAALKAEVDRLRDELGVARLRLNHAGLSTLAIDLVMRGEGT